MSINRSVNIVRWSKETWWSDLLSRLFVRTHQHISASFSRPSLRSFLIVSGSFPSFIGPKDTRTRCQLYLDNIIFGVNWSIKQLRILKLFNELSQFLQVLNLNQGFGLRIADFHHFSGCSMYLLIIIRRLYNLKVNLSLCFNSATNLILVTWWLFLRLFTNLRFFKWPWRWLF